jgi:recombination protein RecA
MKLGQKERQGVVEMIETISTGSLGLDIALGIGGLPKGRIVEIYGPESSGKTTLALHDHGRGPEEGRHLRLRRCRARARPVYARKLGVNLDDLLISQPDTGEQALEIADTLVRSGAVDVLVVDSVAALTPRAELEGEMGESLPGLQARLMSQAMRKLTASISKSNTMVIFINQIRMKIGVMYGSPETTTGGNALKFYASVRLDIRRIGAIKERDEVVGNQTRVKVVKNKLAPPFKQVEFDIMYGEGISKMGELLDLGVKAGVVEKSGAWFSYDSQRIGQGRENAKTFLRRWRCNLLSGVNEIRSTFLDYFRRTATRSCLEPARAAQRPDADVHQCGHGAVQERLHRRWRSALCRAPPRRRNACAPAASTTISTMSATPRAITPSSRCSAISPSATISRNDAIELAWNLITKDSACPRRS